MVVAGDSVSHVGAGACAGAEERGRLSGPVSSSSTVMCPNEATHGKPHLRNWTEVAHVGSSPQLK